MSLWRVTVEYEDGSGKVLRATREWPDTSLDSHRGVLGKHNGVAESLRGVRYALVLIALSAIDQVERLRHT